MSKLENANLVLLEVLIEQVIENRDVGVQGVNLRLDDAIQTLSNFMQGKPLNEERA